MIEELQQTGLFKGLDIKNLEEITEFCQRQHMTDGDILIHEDDNESRDLFVLSEGSAEIISNSSPNISGEVVLSSEFNEVMGEISWLTGSRRTAGVRCHGPVEVIRIDGDALMKYLEHNPEIGFTITRRIAVTLSQRMEESNRLLKQILWNKQI